MKEFLGLCSLIIFFAAGCGLWLLSTEPVRTADAAIYTQKEDAAEADQQMEACSALLPLENGYYYETLLQEEKELYRVLYEAFSRCDEKTLLSENAKAASFDKVFSCVLNDHPELFYVDGFTVTACREDDAAMHQTLSGSYLYEKEEINRRREELEAEALNIIRKSASCRDEYEKVRFVYEYLIKGTEYEQNAPDDQNMCSVLLEKRSVCQGYAKTMQYLLERMGIRALLAFGTVDGGQEHVWNIVRIDGAYYHVDVTWGDAFYLNAHSGLEKAEDAAYQTKAKEPQINYEYLCVPDEQILKTHRISSLTELPRCESMQANYYVKEGLYFESADLERAGALFEQTYADGEAYVTLQCADRAVYEELRDGLIEKQRVFCYLPALEGKIAYTENEQQRTLSFWLQD